MSNFDCLNFCIGFLKKKKKKKKVMEFYTMVKTKRTKALLKPKSERSIESKSNSN